MKKKLLACIVSLITLPASASEWSYHDDVDRISQEKTKFVIAESDNYQDVGVFGVSKGNLGIFSSDKVSFSYVSLDEGQLDICYQGCFIDIRFDDTSYRGIIDGEGGALQIIRSLTNNKTDIREDGLSKFIEAVSKAKIILLRVPLFGGEYAEYEFNFKKPMNASKALN